MSAILLSEQVLRPRLVRQIGAGIAFGIAKRSAASSQMKPQPLTPILRSPRDLLRKAKNDLVRLDEATHMGSWTPDGATFALLDACSALYQIKDWIAVMHPGHRAAARECIDSSLSLKICKDVCTASKHVGLDLTHKALEKSPPDTRVVDYTIGAQPDVYQGHQVLKIRTTEHGDHFAANAIAEAIRVWEAFLDDKKIV